VEFEQKNLGNTTTMIKKHTKYIYLTMNGNIIKAVAWCFT